MKIKNKIKSFFNFSSIEEDLQKEECTKTFEKINLFKVTKEKIALWILTSFILINALVGFDIDFFYIRPIIAFLFLILIPGFLIMFALKIRKLDFWEYLVCTVGLSIAFIMFAGLIVNWTLPYLGISNTPLSTFPVLICFDIFLIILSIVTWNRNKDFKSFNFKAPKLDLINRIFFIVPVLFPILAILGAFLLNNNGPNILTMIMLAGIAVYVLLLVVFREKINPNVYPWALWMIGLSLIFMGWMRSWYLSGPDISKEFFIFNLSVERGIWDADFFRDSYNYMLSLSIFPAILSFFMKINPHLLFKLIIPSLFSLCPLLVYLFSKRYFKNILCFLGSFFFMSQLSFFNSFWIATRQQIAFLFFGLMLLILFSEDINSKVKKFLFLIFGASMIVSHYSTAYIALALFFLTYTSIIIYKKYEKRKKKKSDTIELKKSKFYLTGVLMLLLLVFGFLWYIQVTPTSDGLINFAHKSISNFGNIFEESVQMNGRSPLQQFNIFYKPTSTINYLEDYNKGADLEYKSKYSSGIYYDLENTRPVFQKYSKNLNNKISEKTTSILLHFLELLKIFGKILLIIGIIFIFRYKKIKSKEYYFFIISSIILLSFLIILPFISIDYDLMRIYQQILLGTAILSALGIIQLFGFFKEKKIFIFLASFFILYFLFLTPFVSQLLGGETSVILNNEGQIYDMYFLKKSEISSSNWLLEFSSTGRINADSFAKLKFYLISTFNNPDRIIQDILPQSIIKNSYVFLSNSNVARDISFKTYKGIILSYNSPTEFINSHKNKIYNNGGSEVFK